MKRTKILFTAVMVIALCASLITGATYALFTSGDEVNVAVTSGTVDVEAYLNEEPTLSSEYGQTLPQTKVESQVGGNSVSVTNMVPGDKVEFSISVFNKSNVDVKYQTVINIDASSDLYDALVIKVDGITLDGDLEVKSPWNKIAPSTDTTTAIKEVNVSILLPIDAVDTYQGKTLSFTYSIVAVQGNAYTGPTAKIKTLAQEEIPSYDEVFVLSGNWWGIDFPQTSTADAEIVTAYEFTAEETYEEALEGQYANWLCDFFVECDGDIALGELGFVGAYGAYEDGTIVGFANPTPLAKGESLPMLTWVMLNGGQVGPIPYADVCGTVKTFGCGLFVPYEGAMSGKTVTVSLMMADYETVSALYGEEGAKDLSNYVLGETLLLVNKTEYKFN